MKMISPWNSAELAKQIDLQNRHAWDLDHDISWDQGICSEKAFVPWDQSCLGKQHKYKTQISEEQRIVLSQLMGLIINQTISEMESSLPRLQYFAWEKVLCDYPINPEMKILGEMFFAEEAKHAQSFKRFQSRFCDSVNIDEKDLIQLIPSATGSHFLNAIAWNAEKGGVAFWWLVAAVEEVSIKIFKRMHQDKKNLDPLFYEIHARHTEEEIRHDNYAFLMLEIAREKAEQSSSFRATLFQKTDLLMAELSAIPWVLVELSKIQRVKNFSSKEPFFQILKSCLPIFENMNKKELAQYLFSGAPYISWMINPSKRKKHLHQAEIQSAFSI